MANGNRITTIAEKRSNGFALPVLGLGTYQMGGNDRRNPNNDDDRDVETVKMALGLGFKHIDTAESYADGYAEAIVGQAVKNLDRESLIIATKVRRSNLHYDDVIRSAKASLERLAIKYLDLYLIHGPSPDISLEESMKAMDYLLENELIKNIGVSNFDIPLLEKAMEHTKYRVVNNQIHYGLSARAYEKNGTLDFCRKNNILVTAFRVIGYSQFDSSGQEILARLSKKYNKTPTQIALNWTINKPNIVALVKSSRPEHLTENLAALTWTLDTEDEKYLDTNFPEGETINIPRNFS